MDLLEAAKLWHDAGLQVVPCHADGTKRPYGSWAKLQNNRLEWNDTKNLLEQHLSTGGIGVLLGRPSNVEMIELEGRANTPENLSRMSDFATTLDIFDVWIDVNGGCVEKTPSGGLHFFVRCDDEIEGNQPLAKDESGLVLSETRGQGGFCVVTPSTGRQGHPEGSAYTFEAGSPATIPTVTREQLDKLHRVFACIGIEQPKRKPSPTRIETNKGDERWEWVGIDGVGAIPDAIPTERPGDDFSAKTSWAEILEPHGWTFSHKSGENDHWVRPGKRKTDGSSATTNDTYLYVFTSSSKHFEANKAYNKFGAYAALNTKGDYTEAAKTLKAQGFGVTVSAVVGDTDSKPFQHADLTNFESDDLEVEPPGVWGLFYRGRLNGVYGDPECGKTWLCLAAGVDELSKGYKFAFLDLDANGAVNIARRLAMMGVPNEVIKNPDRFRIYEPADEDDFKLAFAELMDFSADFVVVDSIGEFVPLMNKDSNSNDDVSELMRAYLTPLARDQACVVIVDHLPKNFEARSSGYAIGAVAKKRRIDGAYLQVTVEQPFTPGMMGVAEVFIKKDRLGGLRAKHPNSRSSAGYFCLDSTVRPILSVMSSTHLGYETEGERHRLSVLDKMASQPNKEWNQNELMNELGLTNKRLNPIIDDLLDAELIVSIGGFRSSRWPVKPTHAGIAASKRGSTTHIAERP